MTFVRSSPCLAFFEAIVRRFALVPLSGGGGVRMSGTWEAVGTLVDFRNPEIWPIEALDMLPGVALFA